MPIKFLNLSFILFFLLYTGTSATFAQVSDDSEASQKVDVVSPPNTLSAQQHLSADSENNSADLQNLKINVEPEEANLSPAKNLADNETAETDSVASEISDNEKQFLSETASQTEEKAETSLSEIGGISDGRPKDVAADMIDSVVSDISDKEEEFLNETESQLEEQPETILPANDNVAADNSDDIAAPFNILGKTVKPGKMKRLRWVASETLYGSTLDTPVYVIHGKKPGITLCLTAAVHGDELNGVEIVRQTINNIFPDEFAGTLIGVPIVNLLGFTRGTRYLPDRRDLNRYFPGNSRGSAASRIANSFFEEIIKHCDRLVDFHTGSLNRTNMPQLRANLQIPDVLEFTQNFGSTAVLHSKKLRGNLRTSATNAGIPAVALELGEPGSLQKKQIKDGVKIIKVLLNKLDMIKSHRTRSEPQPIYYSSRWVRVNNGGLLTTEVKVGARVKVGTVLGSIVNPLSNESFEVISPYNGRLLGMALNQFMLPGYAAFNIGLVKEEPALMIDAQAAECAGTGMDPEQVVEEFGCSSDEGDEGEEIERFDMQMGSETGEEEPEQH